MTPIYNTPIACIVANTDKNISDKLKIRSIIYIVEKSNHNRFDNYNSGVNNLDNEIEQEFYNIIDIDLIIKLDENIITTSNHHKHHNLINNYNDIYIIGFDNNIVDTDNLSTDIPSGHHTMKKQSNLSIISEIDTIIEVTYVVYDMLIVNGGYNLQNHSVYFKRQYTPSRIEEPAIIIENSLATVSNDFFQSDIYENVVTPLPRTEKIDYYQHILLKELKAKEKKQAICKCLKENNECVISLTPINYGSFYYECSQCHKPFGYKTYKKWFMTQEFTHTCPHCRKSLSNYPQLYKNQSSFKNFITNMKLPLSIIVVSAIYLIKKNIFH